MSIVESIAIKKTPYTAYKKHLTQPTKKVSGCFIIKGRIIQQGNHCLYISSPLSHRVVHTIARRNYIIQKYMYREKSSRHPVTIHQASSNNTLYMCHDQGRRLRSDLHVLPFNPSQTKRYATKCSGIGCPFTHGQQELSGPFHVQDAYLISS